jgi:ribose transport system substrate-binding protein
MDALKKGLSGGQIGQHPFEMGYRTMFYLLDIKNGAAPPKDPTFTGLDICTADNINTCMTKDE